MIYKIAKSGDDIESVLLSMMSDEKIAMKSWCIDWTISRKMVSMAGGKFCLEVPGKEPIYYHLDQIVSEIWRHRKAFNDCMRAVDEPEGWL